MIIFLILSLSDRELMKPRTLTSFKNTSHTSPETRHVAIGDESIQWAFDYPSVWSGNIWIRNERVWYLNDDCFQPPHLSVYDLSYDGIGSIRMFHKSHVNSVVS